MKQVVLGGAPKRKKGRRPVPKRRRRRTGRQTLNYLLLLIVAAIMIALSLTVLFQVKTVTAQGVTKYAPQALVTACGVQEGDNLLRINRSAVRKRLKELFPYVENVAFKCSFPDKLILQITEATILGACRTLEDGYVIVGDTGRILETDVSQAPEEAMEIYGLYMYSPKVGRILGQFDKEQQEQMQQEKKEAQEAAQKLKERGEPVPENPFDEQTPEEKEKEEFERLTLLVEAIEETEFEKISLIDLSDNLNMAILYDNRVMIELGSIADLHYKLQFVSRILKENLPDNFQGVVDASYCSTSKSVVTSSRNIEQEVEKRKIRAGFKSELEAELPPSGGEDAASQEGTDSSSENSQDSQGNTGSSGKEESSSSKQEASSQSSSTSGSQAGSSSEESSSENSSSSKAMVGPYEEDDLAVRPIPGMASKKEENSSSEGSSQE